VCTACLVGANQAGSFHLAAAVTALLVASATWLFVARAIHQYDRAAGRGALGDQALTALLLMAPLAPILLVGRAPAIGAAFDPRAFTAVLVPAGLALRWITVGRYLWRARPPEQVLVVGSGSLGRWTGRDVVEGAARRHLVGYLCFRDDPPPLRLPAPVLGMVEAMEAVLKEVVVDEVYFASVAPEHTAIVQQQIGVCESFGVPFAIPAYAYRFSRASPADAKSFPDGYLHFLGARPKRFQQMLKRSFDIGASTAALVLLSPVLVATAVAVKTSSKGPVLFRQPRVGYHGRQFDMLKFRSMVADADQLKAKLLALNERDGPVFKMKADPRVTPLGRFIRKYSIDELPQLINVLRGDMSIVGPRPPIPSEVARYEAWQRRRLSVRPGLTCVWQVSGRNHVSFEHWMLLDMRYIDHWNVLADLRLVLRTVPVVLTGRGAS